MDIIEAIQKRKSMRAFKPDPVPQQILKEILTQAQRAPSWANTQPWQFAVVQGEKLAQIKQAFAEKADEPSVTDVLRPKEFPEPYDTRRRASGARSLDLKGIGRDDKEKRRQWQRQGLVLFGAPAAIYIYTDRNFYHQGDSLNVWPIFDCGAVAENIMLLATSYGLGTIPEIQAVTYPDVLRKVLGIPETRLIILGIAIGYPDWTDPINSGQTPREPLESITQWVGF